MAAKPTPGGSDGTYGAELNEFLDESLASDGKIKDGAVFSSSAAPTVDAGVTNKKHVDDNTTMVPAITGAGTGYTGQESITFANGLILKHGEETVTANSTVEVTYGAAFPTAFISAQATLKASSAAIEESAHVRSKSGSTTSILQVTNASSTTSNVYWQAWGR